MKRSNLGAKFLYYFIQSVRSEVWPSHCERIIAWEISHNIDNKSLRKKITLRKGVNQRTGNINTTPLPYQDNANSYDSSSNMTLHTTLQKTKQFLCAHIYSGVGAIWGLIDLLRVNSYCSLD